MPLPVHRSSGVGPRSLAPGSTFWPFGIHLFPERRFVTPLPPLGVLNYQRSGIVPVVQREYIGDAGAQPPKGPERSEHIAGDAPGPERKKHGSQKSLGHYSRGWKWHASSAIDAFALRGQSSEAILRFVRRRNMTRPNPCPSCSSQCTRKDAVRRREGARELL
jgi:hypothetical protein